MIPFLLGFGDFSEANSLLNFGGGNTIESGWWWPLHPRFHQSEPPEMYVEVKPFGKPDWDLTESISHMSQNQMYECTYMYIHKKQHIHKVSTSGSLVVYSSRNPLWKEFWLEICQNELNHQPEPTINHALRVRVYIYILTFIYVYIYILVTCIWGISQLIFMYIYIYACIYHVYQCQHYVHVCICLYV